MTQDNNDPTHRTVKRTHPLGHCQECGEPLRFTPCLNCSALLEERHA